MQWPMDMGWKNLDPFRRAKICFHLFIYAFTSGSWTLVESDPVWCQCARPRSQTIKIRKSFLICTDWRQFILLVVFGFDGGIQVVYRHSLRWRNAVAFGIFIVVRFSTVNEERKEKRLCVFSTGSSPLPPLLKFREISRNIFYPCFKWWRTRRIWSTLGYASKPKEVYDNR